MNNSVLTDKSNLYNCTGCSVCAASCPQKAIDIKLTRDGFYEPTINEEKCTDCGMCKKSCYKFEENVLQRNTDDCKFYSAINKDSNELETTTSGGVSSELMKQCIQEGYMVLGVAYDYEKNIAVTKISRTINELEQFKGSKYFQSFTFDALYEALNDRSEQKYAVFGTPCQIYAISKYISNRKGKDKFLLIDIFCHGCPSLNLWTKYLEYNKHKFGVQEFDRIVFRSKTYGWHEFSTTFFDSDKRYDSSKINDPFYTIFFDKNALNDACYTCKLRSTLAYTDIRLGDFWGYQYDTNTKGVSAVVLCTDKGKELFNKVKNRFEVSEHTFSETIAAQSYGKEHSYNKELREYTIGLLSSDLTMEDIMKVYTRTYSIKKKSKIFLKNVMKHLPQSIYFALKKVVHKIRK